MSTPDTVEKGQCYIIGAKSNEVVSKVFKGTKMCNKSEFERL